MARRQRLFSAYQPLASLSFLSPGLLLRDVFTWVRQTLPEKEMDVLLPRKGPMSTNHACGFPHLIGMFAGRGEISKGKV